VDVERAGVCDTDLQLAAGYLGFRGVLGHEWVGRVVEAPTPSWVGKRVVADINAGCGSCEDCLRRAGHHCERRSVVGIAGRDGAFAEQLCLPERCLVELPAGLESDAAVFAEPLAAALHVLDELPPDLRRPAIVVGDGKLGLLIASCLRAFGNEVTCIGHHREKLSKLAALGVTTLLEAELGSQPERSDFVVEATGSASGLSLALSLARPRARVVLKTTLAAAMLVDLSPVVIHELSLVGSRCGDLQAAVRVLAEGRVDPLPLIAARYPLARADEALARARRRGCLKVLIEVS
jgi:threonine dehydrogenase-like Zn-dependent dehydrogenase